MNRGAILVNDQEMDLKKLPYHMKLTLLQSNEASLVFKARQNNIIGRPGRLRMDSALQSYNMSESYRQK